MASAARGELAEWSAEARPGDAGEAGSPSSAAIVNLAAGSAQNVGRYPWSALENASGPPEGECVARGPGRAGERGRRSCCWNLRASGAGLSLTAAGHPPDLVVLEGE